MPDLSQERLQSLLTYDSETGKFAWTVSRSTVKRGDPAGHINSAGYIQIQIDGSTFQAHRLAWLYCYGAFPSQLDHANLDKTDNRIVNLRISTGTQNQANRAKEANKSSKLKGVTWNRSVFKWQAQIKARGTSHYLGLFNSEDDAHRAYCNAAAKLFGEFGRNA